MAQDDKTRRWSMIAIIAFNFMVLLCMIIYIYKRGGMGGLYFMDFIVTIVLATFAAAAAYVVSMMMDK